VVLLHIVSLLVSLSSIDWDVGTGTTFGGEGDPGNPDPSLACYGRPIRDASDVVVAHRTLPCRSRVVVCLPRTGRCVSARVGDRGPWGRERGRYTSSIDLSPRVATALGHNGRETVLIVSALPWD
jgi:hypothetical protein